jgi:hypothetical protein
MFRVAFARFFAVSTATVSACLIAACGESNTVSRPLTPRVALHVVFPNDGAGDATFPTSGMSPTATPTSPDTASESFTGSRYFAFAVGDSAPLTVSDLRCSGPPGSWAADGPTGAYTGLDVTLSGAQQERCTATLRAKDSDGDGAPDGEDDCPKAPSRTPDGCQGFTVVSIGDSVASGEGNPPWSYKPCHRSELAGPELGFLWFKESAPAQFASEQKWFDPLACSGAQITEGILQHYDGAPDIGKRTYMGLRLLGELSKFRRLPELPPYPARFSQPSQLSQLPSSEDALIISAGANDLGFSDILTSCIAQGVRQYLRIRKRWRTDCEDAKAGVEFDRNERHLAGRYWQLNKGLEALNIQPSGVYVTEYFDPTRDSTGNYCSRVLTIHHKADLRWADRTVLKTLNDALQAAADDYGWHYIGGIASAFRSHGYCAGRNRWVRTLPESLVSQHDPFGAMHPNERGQRCYATRIWQVLYEHLYGASPLDSAKPVGVERACL